MAESMQWRRCDRCFWVVLVAAILGTVDSIIFDGPLPTRSTGDFAEFVGKFCFDFEPVSSSTDRTDVGTFEVRLTNEAGHPLDFKSGDLYFLIFDDERSHWKQVRRQWSSTTCREKVASASGALAIHPQEWNTSYNGRIHVNEHIRPRFWYFAFVGCGLDVQPDFIRYAVHTKNKLWGVQEEFSLDHMNLFYLQAVSFACFACFGIYTFLFVVRVEHPPLREHPYVQFLLMAYSAAALSSGAFTLHYFLVMHSGYGSLRLRFLGVLFGIAGNCVMYLISLLAACGWAITLPELPHRRIFMSLITAAGGIQGLCELHSELRTTQSTQLYVYTGSSGALILVLKMFIFCWFAFQVRSTYLDDMSDKRRRFYKWLGFGVGTWAITVPVATLLAFQLNPWVRFKVVAGFDLASRLLVLLILTPLFCGPLSPLSVENTFSLVDLQNAPVACRADGWRNLPAGGGPARTVIF